MLIQLGGVVPSDKLGLGLTASNIANADTPGYAARDFNFARALRDSTGAANGPSTLTLTRSGGGYSLGSTSQRNLLYAVPSQTSLDW